MFNPRSNSKMLVFCLNVTQNLLEFVFRFQAICLFFFLNCFANPLQFHFPIRICFLIHFLRQFHFTFLIVFTLITSISIVKTTLLALRTIHYVSLLHSLKENQQQKLTTKIHLNKQQYWNYLNFVAKTKTMENKLMIIKYFENYCKY